MSHTMLMTPTHCPILPAFVRMDDDDGLGTRVRSLTDLPDEIKLVVTGYLDRKRDLYHLSLTCRKFEDVVMQRLYERIDIDIPESRHTRSSWSVSSLPLFRPLVLRLVKEVKIRHGMLDLSNQVYNKRRRSEASTIERYMCDLLAQIPKNQLRAFALLHHNPLNVQMLESLSERHQDTLQHLQFFEAEDHLEQLHLFGPESNQQTLIPRNLRTIRCHSVRSGQVVGRLIQANKSTLVSLHIGQEKELTEIYRRNRIGFLEQISQPSDFFQSLVDLSTLPQLRHLSLVGLDLTLFLPRSASSALHFCELQTLTLESCAGAAEFLDMLSSTFERVRNLDLMPQDPVRQPQLKSFLLRHEAFNNALKDALVRFLTTFHGLERLSLLLENATLMERPSTLVANHGATLKILVLECRIQPREHLGLDTSRPLGSGSYSHQLWQESINDICDFCPNLVELGTGFPWDDEMVRLKKTKLMQLSQLRAIHVRNFPQSQVLSQLGDYAIQEHARRFIEWCFPSRIGGERPGLETLAIGPTLYESRWRCGSSSSSSTQSPNSYRRLWHPPEYLRTHHFCLDWAKTRFGRWNAMITPVTEQYVEELRGERPLSGVFEQVWLR